MRVFCLSAVVVLAASYGLVTEASAQRPLPARPEVLVEGKFRGAEGIAFNGEGRLYVAANREGKVWRVDPADGSAVLVTELRGGRILKIPVGARDASLRR